MSPPSLWLQAAAEAAAGQQYPSGCLYVVATPIGNVADMTLRAVHVLALVDAVACEDTRVSAGLLQRLGLHKELLSVHEHNEAHAAQAIVARLQAGQRVAYISDAGTPAVSDPGARLVAATQAAGLRTMPLPGASSVACAVSVAGDVEGAGYRFAGFAPPKPKARSAWLQTELGRGETTVLFEAPHRIDALLEALAELAPERQLTVCRELTKQFEQVVTMPCAAAPAWLHADERHGKGEFALVVHASPPASASGDAVGPADMKLLQRLLAHLPLKEAVSLAAELGTASRNALYALALQWREQAADDEAD